MKHTVDHYPNHYFSIINIISVFTQTYFDLSLEKLANLHDLHRYPKVWHFQFFKSWQSVKRNKISLALWCSAVYLQSWYLTILETLPCLGEMFNLFLPTFNSISRSWKALRFYWKLKTGKGKWNVRMKYLYSEN